MDIIFDQKRSIANVEWIVSQQEPLDNKRISERHISHSVLLEFDGKLIKSLRSHSIKTNKGWTRRRKDVTDGYDHTVKKSPSTKSNGRNHKYPRKSKKKNGKRRTKSSEQKYTAETKTSMRSSSGRGDRRRNGARNTRHSRRGRGSPGDGNTKPSNIKLPWFCSRCQSTNKPGATHCLKCAKPFEFEKDLPNLKRQHYSHTELISNRSIPEMNSTENEIDGYDESE
jgi:hypothetical protein